MNEIINQEDKRGRFMRLAEYRTNEVLKRLRVLGNCANKAAYDYKQEEVLKMFEAIEEELLRVRTKFKNSK